MSPALSAGNLAQGGLRRTCNRSLLQERGAQPRNRPTCWSVRAEGLGNTAQISAPRMCALVSRETPTRMAIALIRDPVSLGEVVAPGAALDTEGCMAASVTPLTLHGHRVRLGMVGRRRCKASSPGTQRRGPLKARATALSLPLKSTWRCGSTNTSRSKERESRSARLPHARAIPGIRLMGKVNPRKMSRFRRVVLWATFLGPTDFSGTLHQAAAVASSESPALRRFHVKRLHHGMFQRGTPQGSQTRNQGRPRRPAISSCFT